MLTWVLCPNLWGARLFQYGAEDQPADSLALVREFARPPMQAKLEDFRDIDEPQVVPLNREDVRKLWVAASEFADYLSVELERACRRNEFEDLVICAEPRFLQLLKKRLGSCTGERLIGVVAVDLYEANESDIVNYMSGVFAERPQMESKVP